jgi:hypothetical protein
MSYAGTAQERCLRLMGKKMLVSLALEGKLASHGLTAMEEDDDVLTALARELVTKQGIGECAAAVWKTLNQQRASRLPALPAAPAKELAADSSPEVVEPFLPEPLQPIGANSQQLAFAF